MTQKRTAAIDWWNVNGRLMAWQRRCRGLFFKKKKIYKEGNFQSNCNEGREKTVVDRSIDESNFEGGRVFRCGTPHWIWVIRFRSATGFLCVKLKRTVNVGLVNSSFFSHHFLPSFRCTWDKQQTFLSVLFVPNKFSDSTTSANWLIKWPLDVVFGESHPNSGYDTDVLNWMVRTRPCRS